MLKFIILTITHNLVFEKDLGDLEKALLETEQRIKKLLEHRESAKKEIRKKSDNKPIVKTLRRLEHNLDNLHKKRALIIKELKD